jgi:hypothetical protein
VSITYWTNCNILTLDPLLVRSRSRSQLARSRSVAVALTDMDAENPRHKAEITELNGMNEDDIVALRWAKPVNRRSPGQRTAHLIVTMNDIETANRAITKGLYICSNSCRVERVRREPPRCLKFQGWNHFAKDCTVENNVCGNCSNGHRTSECPNPQTRRCASCKSSDHASWDRGCPEFVKRLSDFNKRNPENSLQFFPTTETWTWTVNNNDNNFSSTVSKEREKPRHEPPGRPVHVEDGHLHTRTRHLHTQARQGEETQRYWQ